MIRKVLFLVTVIYTVLLITRPQEFIPGLLAVPILQVVVISAFGIWVFMPDKGIELPQFRLLPLFLLSVWLSLGIGDGYWGGIVPALEKLLPPIFLFIIISGCVRSVRELRIYSAVVIACACVLVLHGHLQTTTGIGWTGRPMIDNRITYSGIFDDANDLGLLIVTSLALAMFHLGAKQGWFTRLPYIAAICWLLYGVYLTDSRGTMLAMLLVLGAEVWRAFGKIAVLVGGAIAVPVLIAFTRFSELNTEEESAAGRFEAWYEGLQFVTESPVFGYGWDTFPDHAYGFTAHNSWVLAMAELGIFGYTFWLAFVTLTGWMIFRLAFPGAPRPAARSGAAEFAASPLPSFATPQNAFGLEVQSVGVAAAAPARLHYPDHAGRSALLPQYKPAAAKASVAIPAAVQTIEQRAAFYLFLAASGFACGAFFLSQSYKAMLFLNCGLIVGRYLGAREAGLSIPAHLGRSMRLPLMFGLALVSVVGIWLLVKVLL